MVQLADIQKQAKELSEEDRKGLVAFLLHGFTDMPLGPDDEEVERRDIEMDSGEVAPISHDEFLAQVRRHKAEIAEAFGFDVVAIGRSLQRREIGDPRFKTPGGQED